MSDFSTLSMVPIEIYKEQFKTQEKPVFAELQWFNFSPFCSDVHVYSHDIYIHPLIVLSTYKDNHSRKSWVWQDF